jgi:hypothetical protein
MMTCMVQAQDTIPVASEKVRKITLEPTKSTMYAAALPGLGQIYNRKYWKVPFVYAGFGALGYAVSFNTKHYNTLISAYKDFTDRIPETDSYVALLKNLDPEQYDPVLHPETYNPSTASWVRTQLLNGVDYYRKYRDLSYIGIVAWYLVTIIDANVDASLSDYDISSDLKASIAPVAATFAGLSPGITLTFTKTF